MVSEWPEALFIGHVEVELPAVEIGTIVHLVSLSLRQGPERPPNGL
jgi:hypothetical protein